MYSLGWVDIVVVVELEKRTLVVVGLADIAEVTLVEDGGANTVKETTQTQLNGPSLKTSKQILHIVRCTGCRCRDG